MRRRVPAACNERRSICDSYNLADPPAMAASTLTGVASPARRAAILIALGAVALVAIGGSLAIGSIDIGLSAIIQLS